MNLLPHTGFLHKAYGKIILPLNWLFLAVMLVGLAAAGAADFPTRPVRLVVPFVPGGTLDVVGRLLARQLQS